MELTCNIKGFECYEPDGAFYIFPKINSFFGKKYGEDVINNADDLSMYLLNKAHVSTVTGRAFGQPDCIRLSFANSMENIEKGVSRIKEALEKLS
jgi:aspartate aminotransferase